MTSGLATRTVAKGVRHKSENVAEDPELMRFLRVDNYFQTWIGLAGPIAGWQRERIQVDSSTLLLPGRNTRRTDKFTPKFSRNQGKSPETRVSLQESG
jgi:hypothetical protein